MGVFHDAVRSHCEAIEGRGHDRITGQNPLAYRGAGTFWSRIDQFYLGFDSAHSPQVSEGPSDEPR